MITNVFVVVEDSEMGSRKVVAMAKEKWDSVDLFAHPDGELIDEKIQK